MTFQQIDRFFIGITCFLLSFFSATAQKQAIADSLALVYQRDSLSSEKRLDLLRKLSFNEVRDLNLGLHYAEELIRLSKKAGDNNYLRGAYFLKGNKLRLLGNLDQALDSYFKSADVAKKINHVTGEGDAYGAIADIYSVGNNHQNAMYYYNMAIATLRKSNDSINLASAISNAGDEYLNIGKFDSALAYFREAQQIFDNINYQTGKGYTLGNIGMVYANLGQNDLAEQNINEAIAILEKAQDYYPICVYLLSMADIYLARNNDPAAMSYTLRSLQLAQQHGLKEQISDATFKLSQLYEKEGNGSEALKYYKLHINYRDSINNIKTVQRMADLRTNFEVSQKQAEVNLLNREKKNQQNLLVSLAVILALTMAILGTLFWHYKTIAKEKLRSENLLLNILPAETAIELKKKGKVEAVKFEEVTVLFTDFVEFSKHAEHINPEQLVRSIDSYFKEFDEITTKFGLEKIKTIGDSYMCACGLPTENKSHARNVICAGKEMMQLVRSKMNCDDGMNHFDMRMGIHTGPVVAGIVGIKKWQYDIWGDTVNIASRMESASKPGRINLSETTWEQIRDEFDCEYRGEIEVKNRGLLKMYFLNE